MTIVQQPAFAANQQIKELPPTQTDYVRPAKSLYETDDLVAEPHSVTENTTRHLEMKAGSETTGLPKK